MKFCLLIFLIHSFTFSDALFGQDFKANICDSILLTKSAFEKCKLDSVITTDIIIKTNYISSLKTQLLPKYRSERRNLKIPESVTKAVKKLRDIYDSTLQFKLNVFESDMDKNQNFVQPKAYISSLLSFRLFIFYPDVYAILLNDIHLELRPKTFANDLNSIKNLFNSLLDQIPSKLYDSLFDITNKFQAEKSKLLNNDPIELFQGNIDKDYRAKCNIVNYLLWIDK